MMAGTRFGKRVAILGGGLVGVEVAGFLREREREVTVIEAGATLAPEMAMPRRWRILFELREHGVSLRCDTRVSAIVPEGVEVVDAKGATGMIAADSVILATAAEPNRELSEALEREGCEVHTIGDASAIGTIDAAMRDAARTARAL